MSSSRSAIGLPQIQKNRCRVGRGCYNGDINFGWEPKMPDRTDALRDFRTSCLSRRTLLKGTAASGLLLPFGRAALAQEAPKSGGRLVVGLNAWTSSDTLDPGNFYDSNNALVGFAVYDLLVNRGPDLKPMPWLAESWEANADGSEWVFKLRSGVTFHSGKPFGADDVIYTY